MRTTPQRQSNGWRHTQGAGPVAGSGPHMTEGKEQRGPQEPRRPGLPQEHGFLTFPRTQAKVSQRSCSNHQPAGGPAPAPTCRGAERDPTCAPSPGP